MQFSKNLKSNFSQSILILLSFLVITSCKKKDEEEKQPSAEFNFDKSDYFEGETINLINSSSDANTYRWTMPDGQTSKTENPSYTPATLNTDQYLQFKLEAISKSGLKTDYAVKNVSVKARKGRLVIYNFYSQSPVPVDAIIDGVNYEIVMQPTSTEPNCGEGNHPTFDLIVGTHSLIIKSGSFVMWSGEITITANACTKIKVGW